MDIRHQLNILKETASTCHACALAEGRTQIVFGTGNSDKPQIAFVGEGPGADEDREGIPFVGRAGQFLNKLIGAMQLKREEVYILNTVMCRPPGNRTPLPEELTACNKFMSEQLKLVQPNLIVALGKTAGNTLLNLDEPIYSLRKKWWDWNGIPVRVTFHPSYLLRCPHKRPLAYDDLTIVVDSLRSGFLR